MKTFYVLKGGDVDVSGAPKTIPILPLGHVVSAHGPFDVDAESLREMQAGIAKRGVDLVIDYEHQTLKGVEAPAAGWVKGLKLEGGHINAVVEWTERGRQYLENKEYRYVSPVITVRKSDGKAIGLHSIALTNTPAIEGMTPIANSLNFEGGQRNMNTEELLKQLAKLLGLEEDADAQAVTEALKACVTENKSLKDAGAAEGKPAPEDEAAKQETEKVIAYKAVCELLGLSAGAATADVTAKIMALKGGIVDGVNLAEKLRELEQKDKKREADEAVTLALKAGKITPAQTGWATSYALSDPKGFDAFAEKAPQIVPFGALELADTKAHAGGQPDAATLLVCKQLGVNAEDIAKYGKE